MPNADIILLILLGGFVLYGFWFGLIHAIGGLVGVVFGTLFAGRLYEPVSRWLTPIFGLDQNVLRILSFAISFIIINRLVGFVFWIIEKVFRVVAVIPFLKTINRLAGALFGLIEGIFLLGGIIFIMARFPVATSWQDQLKQSNVARYLVSTYSVMTPLLPRQLRDFDPSSYFPR